MTKITIVDENDKVIGSEEREVAVKNNLYHRIVRVIVRNSNGEVYLQKRGINVPTMPNIWDQSVGGHVDEGEDYGTAAKREMEEELGIKNTPLKFVAKWYQAENVGKNDLYKRFHALYEAKYDAEIVLSKESSTGAWFQESKIKKWMANKPDNFTLRCIFTFGKYWNDELLDLVNEKDEVIGTVWKSDAHIDPQKFHREVGIAVFNNRGQTLIQQRSRVKSDPLMWKVAAAGHVASGEKPAEAAAREVFEELGIKVKPIFYEKIFKKRIGLSGPTESRFVYAYYAIVKGTPKLKLDKKEVKTV